MTGYQCRSDVGLADTSAPSSVWSEPAAAVEGLRHAVVPDDRREVLALGKSGRGFDVELAARPTPFRRRPLTVIERTVKPVKVEVEARQILGRAIA